MEVKPKAIIIEGQIDTLIESAEEIGRDLARNRLSSSQIRNVFGEVRRIEMNWPIYKENMSEAEKEEAKSAHRSAVLLRPKLAYQAKRERGAAVSQLKDALDPCLEILQKCNDPQNQRIYFRRFVDFFEAILAYHKDAGGN